MPSLLQSVFKNVGFVESNLASTGDEVMQTLRSSNNCFNASVHAEGGIGFL